MLRKRLRQFSALTGNERLILIYAGIALAIIAVLLNCTGYNRTRRLIPRIFPQFLAPSAEGSSAEECAGHMVRMIKTAGAHGLYHARCLEQALLLQYWLNSNQIAATIQFGVPVSNLRHTFNAHAWVIYNGVNISDTVEVRRHYVALMPL